MDCVICKEQVKKTDILTNMPCCHIVFHLHCFLNCTKINPVRRPACMYCQASITAAPLYSEGRYTNPRDASNYIFYTLFLTIAGTIKSEDRAITRDQQNVLFGKISKNLNNPEIGICFLNKCLCLVRGVAPDACTHLPDKDYCNIFWGYLTALVEKTPEPRELMLVRKQLFGLMSSLIWQTMTFAECFKPDGAKKLAASRIGFYEITQRLAIMMRSSKYIGYINEFKRLHGNSHLAGRYHNEYYPKYFFGIMKNCFNLNKIQVEAMFEKFHLNNYFQQTIAGMPVLTSNFLPESSPVARVEPEGILAVPEQLAQLGLDLKQQIILVATQYLLSVLPVLVNALARNKLSGKVIMLTFFMYILIKVALTRETWQQAVVRKVEENIIFLLLGYLLVIAAIFYK